MYEKFGFEFMDEVEFDLGEYGLEGSDGMTEMIRWSEEKSEV